MRTLARLLWLVIALIATAAGAQDAGRVSFVSGEAYVERGGARITLAHDSVVRQGDMVRTGADGNLQLVMVDGARVAMRPGTELRIEQYEFRAEGDPGRALLNLVNGTLRVFTGALVGRNRERFQMKTNLATIGIRGSGNILVNLGGTETFNHTLTGAHSVTSIDAAGVERTLISRPGQTVQVLPRQGPRYVPTPPMVTAAAAPPATQKAAPAEKASDTTASSSTSSSSSSGGTSTSSSSSSSASASSSSSQSTATSGTSGSSNTASSESAAGASSSTTATTTTTTATTTATTPASEPPAVATTTTSPATSTATTTTTNPGVTASQATTGAVGSSIATAQPPAQSANYSVVFRFFNPIATGFEGVLGQDGTAGSAAVLDNGGRLVSITDGSVTSFLAGPGAEPPGYAVTTFNGDVTFSNGTHHDAFRSPDSSVILGRWEGGIVSVADPSGTRTFDLGPRSVSYQVVTPTPSGIVGSFTGTATYTLAGATAPTDSAGHVGSVSSASIAANFTSRTMSGTFALAINAQAFSLTGVAGLAPGASDFAFASALQNLTINCSGSNCASAGYLGTLNGQIAGTDGRWIAITYRLNPNRTPGSGFSDFVTGSMALDAGAAPNVGVTLPRTGTASLVFTAVDPNNSFSTYPGATGTPAVSGSISANFSSQTANVNVSVSGGATAPTLTASASNVPIVGAGFSASSDSQRPTYVAALAVGCSGSGCGPSGSAQGRFDGLFRNSTGTAGVAQIVLGDSNGAYEAVASFGLPGSTSQIAAADARAAMQRIVTPPSIAPVIASTFSHPGARIAKVQ